MQFSEHWLRSMVDPPLGTEELARLLTMSGLEIETCVPVAPPFSGVVTGEVVTLAQHPNADLLKLCRVSVGAGEPLQVVCGAPNVKLGMKAPFAHVGARLPGGLEIKAAQVRGVQSGGMLCSARELGLSEDHSGLLALPGDTPLGRDIREILALDDHLLTLKLTPNRADCLSLLGVAREVSALTGALLTPPEVSAVPAVCDAVIQVRISEPQGCGRFAGRVIRNVNAAAPTPEWMRRRLERSGQRSISALVDVTNYVMLELGRPLHVYDVDKLSGGIDVRYGRRGEKVKLLNEQTVEVDETVLCITDDSGAIGLAGIMGGESTKADLATRHVFLESAFFHPGAIAGRARRYNFTSDASYRFERGVDFENNAAGIERATHLILDICGGEPGPSDDVAVLLPQRNPVRMRIGRAELVIGIPVPAAEMEAIFRRLGFTVTREPDAFVATAPSYRFDIAIEEDLIEEVARVHGFDRIPADPPVAPVQARTEPEAERSLHQLRERIAGAGYQEVINFSFVDPVWEADFAGNAEPITLLNPIASQLAVMRSTLLGGLVSVARTNLNRKCERVRAFEVGRAFMRDPAAPAGGLAVAGVQQPMRVAGIACGPASEEQWGIQARAVDFFDVKGDVESLLAPLSAGFERAAHPALHPGRSARVLLGGTPIGWLGELHPRWQKKYELPMPAVLFELETAPLTALGLPHFEEPSNFPPVIRDLAVVVDAGQPAKALLDALEAEKPRFVREIRLFDLYQGKGVPEGRKSLAFRIVMQDTDRTLTDAEADLAITKMVELLGHRFSATIRT
ncbi:MAG: phenylalanine--tRNA ligase subunit beta [Betaproteobacteria bacterium]|nr:phenylalanine--tRNA ligase subunit beta [Betaproteobacteria bacterium]